MCDWIDAGKGTSKFSAISEALALSVIVMGVAREGASSESVDSVPLPPILSSTSSLSPKDAMAGASSRCLILIPPSMKA
jgi:hypothetical protein